MDSQEPGTASEIGLKSRPQHPMRREAMPRFGLGLQPRMLAVQNTAGESLGRFDNSRDAQGQG